MTRGGKLSKNRRTAFQKAGEGWGAALPEWVERLALACDAEGLNRVAARLEVSPALVSLAVRNLHHGGYGYIEGRVREVLLAAALSCPVLGRISVAQCREEQRKPFMGVNPLAVAVYRACRGGCEHYKGSA